MRVLRRIDPIWHKKFLFFLCVFACIELLSTSSLVNMTTYAKDTRLHALHRSLAAYTVTGTVFDDYNQNGTQQAGEPGMNGVNVSAFDANGAIVAATTTQTVSGVLGQYSLSIPDGTGPVRIQFSNFGPESTIPDLAGYESSNHLAGTTVAFVSSDQPIANLGIERPGDYCQNNPNVASSCYIRGDQSGTQHVLVRFPYNNSGETPMPTGLANANDIGTTWGLAYRRSSDSLFAAAYMKRHAGFKPGQSTGAIYLIQNADTASPSVNAQPFVDLNAIFGVNTAGANLHTSTDDYFVDGTAYDAVGKDSLGGLALSEDETTLYVMNLADRMLYTIPVGTPPATPIAGSITRTDVPRPASCPDLDFRPFAVSSYHGIIYVGAVCSAESTISVALPKGDPSKMQAYVFAYTPGTGFNSTPVFQFPLNYPRRCANDAFATNCLTADPAAWNPWNPTYMPNGRPDYVDYPQPMLTSIAFDRGNMILGIRDRFGDQTGNVAPSPDGLTPNVRGISAGDMLRACLNTQGDLSSGWTLEDNASCGGVQTAGQNNTQGPGNGEYYYQEFFSPYHDEIASGGLLQIPGFPGVMTTVVDPTTNIYTGGVRTFDNTTGVQTNGYQIYDASAPLIFGKASGMGSLVAFCQAAPIEIGNRIWLDSNGNGIQDPGESPIEGVTVNLYASDGTTLIKSTKTDASGNYYFMIDAYTSYVIKIDNAADYSAGGPLAAFGLTSPDQGSDHTIDSDATLPTPLSPIGTGNYPQITVDPHNPGQNDHTFDVGFLPYPDLSITKTNDDGDTFEVGDRITYHLTVHAEENAGPIIYGSPITVTDTIPTGLSNVQAESSDDWDVKVNSSADPVTVVATYRGTYPVIPGSDLTPITFSAQVDEVVTTLTNTVIVETPGDANPDNDSGSKDITVVDPSPSPTPTPKPKPPHGGHGHGPGHGHGNKDDDGCHCHHHHHGHSHHHSNGGKHHQSSYPGMPATGSDPYSQAMKD